MRVIITEKPSVARQFCQALKIPAVDKEKKGYYEGQGSDGKYYKITYAIGHLIGMSYPEKYDEELKSWKLENLPFIPQEWKYEVISAVKDQYNNIKKVFKSMKAGDIYYNAGDSGREGEYIQNLIVQEIGLPQGVIQKRIWIDSQTDDEILRGIREAKPVSDYKALSESAYVRAKEDYLVGINFSRLLSCAYGREFNEKIKSQKYKPLTVGRVMTCVLGMIVRREREIRDFKEQKYYRIEANTGFKSGWKVSETSKYYDSEKLYSETGFKRYDDAAEFVAFLSKTPRLLVDTVKKTDVKKPAPTLYNLAELQAECSKRLKISPDKTLEIAQSLYEKKLTTYPRTDARVISTPVAKEIDKNIKGIRDNLNIFVEEVSYVLGNKLYEGIDSKKRYTNDSKITDHYAIIPTGEGSMSSLNELEKEVYDMIVRRFLAIFYEKATYKKIEIVLTHENKEKFSTSTEVLVDKGYLSVYKPFKEEGDKEEKVDLESLNKIVEGDVVEAAFDVSEGKTTPPKRYTTGTMIIAMENAGKLIEDEDLRETIKSCGIGTSATRAETISKLIKLKYISLNEKTQVLTPHADGESVYDIVDAHIPGLLVPEMTAEWEQGLEGIYKKEVIASEYLGKIEDFVRTTVDEIKKTARVSPKKQAKETKYICPRCFKNMQEYEKVYKCGCGYMVFRSFCLHEFSDEEMSRLLHGDIVHVEGLISKAGNEFAQDLILSDEGKIEFYK